MTSGFRIDRKVLIVDGNSENIIHAWWEFNTHISLLFDQTYDNIKNSRSFSPKKTLFPSGSRNKKFLNYFQAIQAFLPPRAYWPSELFLVLNLNLANSTPSHYKMGVSFYWSKGKKIDPTPIRITLDLHS